MSDPDELMDDLRIPTATFEAEVLCVGGRTLIGSIFLPVSSSWHPGPMRPEERMNDGADFFPFRDVATGRSVVLNKCEVVRVSFNLQHSTAPHIDQEESMPPSAREQRVIITCREYRVEGALAIDMPDYKRRLLDYLNGPDRFIVVAQGHRRHLINKALITEVHELEEQ